MRNCFPLFKCRGVGEICCILLKFLNLEEVMGKKNIWVVQHFLCRKILNFYFSSSLGLIFLFNLSSILILWHFLENLFDLRFRFIGLKFFIISSYNIPSLLSTISNILSLCVTWLFVSFLFSFLIWCELCQFYQSLQEITFGFLLLCVAFLFY